MAIINKKRDFSIALNRHWYRISTFTKFVPNSVKNGDLKFIAFYQTSIFKEQPFQVRWYAKVNRISIVQKKDLSPEFETGPKADNYYYKIEFDAPQPLPNIIHSARHRRILFINTSYWHLRNAKEINDLFYESPLEERLWEVMKEGKINAERQFFIQTEENFYILDFALFCKLRNINIECDGNKFHLESEYVIKDKSRNNKLESLGWSVLRYTTKDIRKDLGNVVSQIKETINRYGGLQALLDLSKYNYFANKDSQQLDLFGW